MNDLTDGTLRKCFHFLVGIKTFEMSVYIQNLIFTKNVNIFEIPRLIFPKIQQISLKAL